MQKFTVSISETNNTDREQAFACSHYISGLSLSKAWRIVQRHARRGVKLYGGKIQFDNWGGKGGVFPQNYRRAVIRLDTFR